ncbi:MAG: hypothetical protein NTW96_26045 [Planctomycetia bacterium]|nr:hypothetical protein [Planctomycetia bacterium]
MEAEYATEFEDLPDAHDRITSVLPIPTLNDPIKTLHENVHATDCTLVADDGSEYESLFNKFTSGDNPSWR